MRKRRAPPRARRVGGEGRKWCQVGTAGVGLSFRLGTILAPFPSPGGRKWGQDGAKSESQPHPCRFDLAPFPSPTPRPPGSRRRCRFMHCFEVGFPRIPEPHWRPRLTHGSGGAFSGISAKFNGFHSDPMFYGVRWKVRQVTFRPNFIFCMRDPGNHGNPIGDSWESRDSDKIITSHDFGSNGASWSHNTYDYNQFS